MMTRTLRGFRRSPVAGDTRNCRICARFRASGSGIPLALPIAVAASIQNVTKTVDCAARNAWH